MFADLGDGVLDDVVWAGVELPENQRVGEGLGETFIVDHWAEYSKRSGPLVLVVEDGIGEELFESSIMSLWVMGSRREA